MENLKKYFSNLLILQYKNKPKAKATIETLVEHTFSDTVGNIFPIEVQNSYDLNTSTGTQLDVIGKYLGYDRSLSFTINNAFNYDEYDESISSSLGYAEYTHDKNTDPYLEYRYNTYEYYNITDNTYRKVLKMLSKLKSKPLSLGNIDEVLKEVFGDGIYVVEGEKSLEYHLTEDESFIYQRLDTQEKVNTFFRKFFPKPMGCTLIAIKD